MKDRLELSIDHAGRQKNRKYDGSQNWHALHALINLMKSLAFLLTALACFFCRQTLAASQPRGSMLELHSCELYAGGCVVSSEATQGGRYMLRAWHFSDGSFQ